MKNLSYFLWLCVGSLAGYVAYFLSFTTNFREQDLTVVGQQNRSLEMIIKYTQLYTNQHIRQGEVLTTKQGKMPKDVAILTKATTVHLLTKQYLQHNKVAFQEMNRNKQWQNYATYSKKVSEIDTTLKNVSEVDKNRGLSSMPHFIFQENYWVMLQNKMIRIENKSVERLTAQIGGIVLCCFCERMMVYPYNEIVTENNWYEAQMCLVSSRQPPYLISMYIAKDSVKIEVGEGKIIIPYTPLQFDANGINKQTVKGKVIIKDCFIQDTLVISRIYTVKRKK